MSDHSTSSESFVVEEDDTAIHAPRRYHVVMHNDDFTTMEFVQEVLVNVFHHTPSAAGQLLLEVHTTGKVIAGTYTKDIAETKAHETINLARSNGFPLRCSVEPSN